MRLRINKILTQWTEEETVRCVVISDGQEKLFCYGFDNTIPIQVEPEMEKVIRAHNPLELTFKSIKNFPYSTIAMCFPWKCFWSSPMPWSEKSTPTPPFPSKT
jgi:enoyl-CoA hydratase/carnithine racemase